MKKLFALSIFLFVLSTGYGQKKLKTSPTWRAVLLNNNVYRTYNNINEIFIVRDNDDKYYYSKAEQSTKYLLDLNGRDYVDYKIIRESDGILFFKILPCAKIDKTTNKITVESEINDKCPSEGADNATNYIFGVSNRALTVFEKAPVSSRLVLTPIVHPVKYRPAFSGKEPSLTGEITLSFNIGYRFRLNNQNLIRPTYLTIVPYGIGLSSSQYFKANTNDRAVPGNISLTYLSFGAFLSFDRYNIGLFAGKDAMMTKSQKDWHYQDQMWYSFGLGYSLK